jgi:hypothetical protein
LSGTTLHWSNGVMPCTWAEAAAAGTTATEPLSRQTNRVLLTIRLTTTLLSRVTKTYYGPAGGRD